MKVENASIDVCRVASIGVQRHCRGGGGRDLTFDRDEGNPHAVEGGVR
jgi:hypothetical protein